MAVHCLRCVAWCLLATAACQVSGRLLFATKTPYDLSRKLFGAFFEETLKRPVLRSSFFPADACTPLHLSVLLRHGSRFPSPGDVEDVAEFVRRLHESDIGEEFAHLKNWTNPFTMDVTKTLGHAGFVENVDIAKRTVANFERLFSGSKSSADAGRPDIALVASNTSRTVDSAKGFATGLSHALSIRDLSEDLKLDNSLLRFFDTCQRYVKTVESNKSAAADFHTFRHGPEMQAAADRVSKRLGLRAGPPLTTDELKTIWVMCGYETSLFRDRPSSWCKLLTPEDTDTLEYTWDLKSYWKKAHGHEVNYAQSCPLIDRIIGNLEGAAAGRPGVPKLAAYFAHAETVLPVLAALGLFNDSVPLLASNFDRHRASRSFRSSYIASFACNVALVLYRCQPPGARGTPVHPHWGDTLAEHMVQLMVNEHAVPFPFAGGRLAVPYSEVLAHYAHRTGSACRFADVCSMSDTAHQSTHPEAGGLPSAAQGRRDEL